MDRLRVLVGRCTPCLINDVFFRRSGISNESGVLYKPIDTVPVSDQHLALGILLELAVQQGALQHLLEAVLLLLKLWDTGQDNDNESYCTSAPLVPLLKRFQDIPNAPIRAMESTKMADDVSNQVDIINRK